MMTRYLVLLLVLAASLVGSLAMGARAIPGAATPPGWATAVQGLTPEPPDHLLLGPISAAGRKAWDCWPQREAESATLDPVFPTASPAPAPDASPRP